MHRRVPVFVPAPQPQQHREKSLSQLSISQNQDTGVYRGKSSSCSLCEQKQHLFLQKQRTPNVNNQKQKEKGIQKEGGNHCLQGSDVGRGAGISASLDTVLHLLQMFTQREDEQEKSNQGHSKGYEGKHGVGE